MGALSIMDGNLTNGASHPDSTSAGLKVIIVGGGIGGFTAGIALRQQGHHVEVSQPLPAFLAWIQCREHDANVFAAIRAVALC